MNATVYCVDTSSIIEAWSRTYPIDVFPGFWRDFDLLIQAERLCAPDEVRKELLRKEDDLASWAAHQQGFFIPFDSRQQARLVYIMDNYEFIVKNTKQKHAADPHVIALAWEEKYTIVTEEGIGGPSKTRIPDVCRAIGVKDISILDLMRRESWKY